MSRRDPNAYTAWGRQTDRTTPAASPYQPRGEIINRRDKDSATRNTTIERGVKQLKRTVHELEASERTLLRQKRELESKLDILSKDYEKLCSKYEMIEVIVAEKEKIIGIYESKVKELSRPTPGEEQLLVNNKMLTQENARLNDLIERNSIVYADKLRSMEEAILRLERSEHKSIRSVKIPDLSLAAALQRKDMEITSLNAQIQELRRKVRNSHYQSQPHIESVNVSQFSHRDSDPPGITSSRNQEEYFMNKITRLEAAIRDRDNEIQLLRKGVSLGSTQQLATGAGGASLKQSMIVGSVEAELRDVRAQMQLKATENLELQALLKNLSEQLKIKDVQIAKLQAKALGGSSLSFTPPPASSSAVAAVASAAAQAALLRENNLLNEQIQVLKQRILTLETEAKITADKYQAIISNNRKPLQQANDELIELRNINESLQLQIRKQSNAVRAKDSMQGTLAQELDKEIELSTQLKNEVDHLNLQLKKALRDLEHQKIAVQQKEKSYEDDIRILREQKVMGDKHLTSREVDLQQKEFTSKNYQAELQKANSEIAYLRDLSNKNDSNYREASNQAIDLRKKLAVSQDQCASLNETVELQKLQIEKFRKLKKEIDSKTSEATQKSVELAESNATVQALNEQLTLKNKSVKELQNKVKVLLETSENKEIQLENEIRRAKDAKKKVDNDFKDLQSDYNALQDRLQNTLLEAQREKDFWLGVQKKSQQYLALLEQERKEKDDLVDEVAQIKKQSLKLKKQRDEARRQCEERALQIQQQQEDKAELINTIKSLQVQIQRLTKTIENQREENQCLKQSTQKAEEEVQQYKSIAMELRTANAQFSKNEVEYTRTIEELQKQVIDAKNESEDYNPRYQALIQRNKELDQRNAELADMLNKAIERQANQYKDKVLGDVAKNASSIFQHLKESVVLSQAKRRRPLQEQPKEAVDDSQNVSIKSPPKQVKKEDPYKKIVGAKISDHKRRISESAHKLVELLDIEKDGRSNLDSMGDYQRINQKIESIELQKSSLLNKINSYAEKLRIL